MDPFETFDVTLFPHRVVLMPSFAAPPYVDVDPDDDLKLLRHLLSSAEMDTLASGLLREYALGWPAVRLEEVEADTHATVVARVMEAVEAGALVGAVADLEDIMRPVRVQEVREIGSQDIVLPSRRTRSGAVTPVYEDKLLTALEMLPDAVAARISARAAQQLRPYFTDKTLNVTAGVFIVWCGNRSVGTEYVVDGGLLGVAFAHAGWDCWKALDLVHGFFVKVDASRSEFHIRQAVVDLADAIRYLGVEGFLGLLRSVTPKRDETTGGGATGAGPKTLSGMKRGRSEPAGKPLNTEQKKPASPPPARATAKESPGSKGDWNKALNKPKPDTDYEVGPLTYSTDDKGRVTKVSGKLPRRKGERNPYQQKVSGREDRLETDDGGHLIATQLGGAGEGINIVPMDSNFNRGRYKQLENTWAKARKDGKTVDVTISVIYPKDSKRPKKFIVQHSIDGVTQPGETFKNRRGGK